MPEADDGETVASYARGNCMKSTLLTALCVAIYGCGGGDSPTIPTSDAAIRGSIRGRGDLGSMLVVASAADSTSCDPKSRAQVQLGHAPILFRSGGTASASSLQVGVFVSVWITGLVLDTCPAIVTAQVIVIEDMGS